jgi:hypothetical protein
MTSSRSQTLLLAYGIGITAWASLEKALSAPLESTAVVT